MSYQIQSLYKHIYASIKLVYIHKIHNVCNNMIHATRIVESNPPKEYSCHRSISSIQWEKSSIADHAQVERLSRTSEPCPFSKVCDALRIKQEDNAILKLYSCKSEGRTRTNEFPNFNGHPNVLILGSLVLQDREISKCYWLVKVCWRNSAFTCLKVKLLAFQSFQ